MVEAAQQPSQFGAGLRSEIERRHIGEAPAGSHLAFLPSPRGYSLVERLGPAPEAGSLVDEGGERLRVSRVGRSPLPWDSRRCAYLEPA